MIQQYINDLSEIILDRDVFKLVRQMKQIVPEFVSNNSVYESLDMRK